MSFEDLDCWQACRKLRKFVALEIVPDLPPREKFSLGTQILHPARSAASSIADGHARLSHREALKAFSASRSSINVVLDHLITAHDEGIIGTRKMSTGRNLANKALLLLDMHIATLPPPPEKPARKSAKKRAGKQARKSAARASRKTK